MNTVFTKPAVLPTARPWRPISARKVPDRGVLLVGEPIPQCLLTWRGGFEVLRLGSTVLAIADDPHVLLVWFHVRPLG